MWFFPLFATGENTSNFGGWEWDFWKHQQYGWCMDDIFWTTPSKSWICHANTEVLWREFLSVYPCTQLCEKWLNSPRIETTVMCLNFLFRHGTVVSSSMFGFHECMNSTDLQLIFGQQQPHVNLVVYNNKTAPLFLFHQFLLEAWKRSPKIHQNRLKQVVTSRPLLSGRSALEVTWKFNSS